MGLVVYRVVTSFYVFYCFSLRLYFVIVFNVKYSAVQPHFGKSENRILCLVSEPGRHLQ